MRNTCNGARLAACLALALPGVPGAGGLYAQEYRDFAGLTAELQALAGASTAARLGSLGTTPGGREIWVMEIADPEGPSPAQRPGVLVVGNLSGDHLIGSSHAVDVIRHLTTSDDEDVRRALAERVVYVIPRLNPDGAEAMFAAVRRDRTRNARPFDDDNDGRVDEDGPDDLNGDGIITAMRVADPTGDYVVDPDEARLMRRADPVRGESGTHALYWEGTDDDGDGFYNEDGPGGVDLDRNFQHAYPYWDRDAGPHMVSEPESRALMDFVITHRNIGAILTFGHTDNLVTPPNSGGTLAGARRIDLVSFADASDDGAFEVGVFSTGGGGFGFGFGFGGGGQFRGAQPGRDNDPSSGRRPSMSVHSDDVEYFEEVSEAYREITGIESVGFNREAEGAFFQYGYFQFGVPAFGTQGWGMPGAESDEANEGGAGGEEAEAGEAADRPAGPGVMRRGGGGQQAGGRGGDSAGEGIDSELLAALEAAGIDAFSPWTSHAHPTLGEVEIGGFVPYATTNPPEDSAPELGPAHGEFVVRLAGMLPRVQVVETDVTDHGGGIFTVEAVIENTGFFPTSLQHGIVAEAVQPVTVQIQVPPEDVLTGADKTSRVRQLAGSGSRESFRWVIRGEPGSQVEIRVRAQKGGTDTATVTLE